MKVKYKKMIILISMSTMGIALLTFSMGNQNNKQAKGVQLEQETQSVLNTDIEDGSKDIEDNSKDIKVEESNGIKRDAYPEVNTLVEKYLNAIVNCDESTLKELVNNVDNIDVEKIQKESEYIEDYRNIECYTKAGYENGSYIVFVYEEVKIVDIETLAPGMRRLYVCTDEDGKIYIYNSRTDSETEEYIQNIMKDEDVKTLIETVNKKFEVAVSQDSDLRDFLKKLSDVSTE